MTKLILHLLIGSILSFPALLQAGSTSPASDVDMSPRSSDRDIPGQAKPSEPSPPIADAVYFAEQLFESSDVPVLADARVEAQIDYFSTTGKPSFQRWLDHSSRFLPLMKEIFRENELPEDLVYVAMIESGLRMNAVSRSHAVGPWQFMSTTAKTYGLKVDKWIDERRDPVKSTQAAAAYLRDLYRHFGSWRLALASYNAGEGRISRALYLSQDNDLPDLYESTILHRETRNYVPRLLAAILIARDPEQYGFVVKNGRAFSYDEVLIDESTDLGDIAALVGCTYEDLRDLNPELKTRISPPYVNAYILRLPAGTREGYVAAKKMLFRRVSLITPRFDAAYDPLDGGRPHEYAVLRKRYQSRSASRRRQGRPLQKLQSQELVQVPKVVVPVVLANLS
ncbi:MAG TPA: transglycosylase SLT domain-containing protein [Nitrospirota bacterium]|nr:transglycosylase SLT domain-containing protein [Nitrospirota bacterium]